jgi:hypothetical protein
MLAACAQADRAIVVGVGDYPSLGPRAQLLGPPADAQDIKVALDRFGFNDITVFTNEAATREAIINALKKANDSSRASERFVFYFAGHGRKRPVFGILPHDARPADRWITAHELHELVKVIPASSRTIILDSCFSGGMAKNGLVTRYYEPANSKGPDFADDTTNAGPLPESSAGTEVCYVTAAQKTEEAAEAFIGGDLNAKRGVFTYFLSKHLQDKDLSWEEIIANVRSEMRLELEKYPHYQSPLVTNAFLKLPVFNGMTTTSPTANAKPSTWSPKTLLDLYETQERDPSLFRLVCKPNEACIPLGQAFSFSIEAKIPGYLVIVAEDAGKFIRIYPSESSSAEDAAIGTIPPRSQQFIFVERKDEPIRAFLFDRKEDAQLLIENVPEYGREITARASDISKVPRPVRIGQAKVLVSGLMMKPQLEFLAGIEVTDAEAFWNFLNGDSELATKARRRLGGVLPELVEVATEPSRRTPEMLCAFVNFCVSEANLFFDAELENEHFEARLTRNARLFVAGSKGLRVGCPNP